jgi:hypothetical protein
MRRTVNQLTRPSSVFFSATATLATAVALCCLRAAAAQDEPEPNPAAPTAPASQDKPSTPVGKPPDFSKEALVFDKIYTRIHEEADGTGIRETTVKIRILADAGVKEMAVLAFTYTALSQQMDIGYVRVIKPDGTVVVTPDYNVQDLPADVTRTAPMYSDIHQKHVAVKGLGVGDTLEYQTTLRTLKPEVPGQFWVEYTFEKDVVILDEQLDLDVPAGKAVTVASTDVQPTITTAAARKLYHWASANLARPDPDAPPKSTKHWKPAVQVTTFASWEQVGAWYASLQQDSLVVTPAIQARVAKLTEGLSTDEDKLQVIFNDVALHIHYVGLEFGIGRYQPHPADDVLSNEYGDCKDKHTLLATELKAAGIQAWPVLISDGRDLDPALPSPAQFDHVITLASLNGKTVWMDSTAEVAPVGVLMAVLRDKQALAVPESKPAYLATTPAELPAPRSLHIEVSGKLSPKGQFTGHISETTNEDIAVLFRSGFRSMPQSQWKDLIEGIAHNQGYAGEASNPQVSEIDKINQPFQFSFDYTREKYYQWDDNEIAHWISAPLPAIGGELAPGVKEKKPADDVDLSYAGDTVYHATLQLPKGWTMVPPKNINLKEDWIEYRATYSFKDCVFTAEREAVIKDSKVPLAQWDKYLALRRGMFDDLNHTVLISPSDESVEEDAQAKIATIISRQANDPVMPDLIQPLRDAVAILDQNPPLNSQDQAKAMDLAKKGLTGIEAKTVEVATADVHSLYWSKALAYAWYVMGRSAFATKDLATAENYLRAAWRLGQDRISGYQLALVLEAKGNKAGAAHQFELANASSVSDPFLSFLVSGSGLKDQISEGYKRVAGKALTSTSLNDGRYDGSLRAELDRDTEIHEVVRTTKLNGQALFSVAFEAGKPVKVNPLGDDKAMASLVPVLQAHTYPSVLPAGSKARLLREFRVICTPYAGCDAYILLPNSIQGPIFSVPRTNKQADGSDGSKVIEIQLAPQ